MWYFSVFYGYKTQHKLPFLNFIERAKDDPEDSEDPEELISEIKALENEDIDDIIGTISGLFQDLETRGIAIEGKPFKKPSSFRIK